MSNRADILKALADGKPMGIATLLRAIGKSDGTGGFRLALEGLIVEGVVDATNIGDWARATVWLSENGKP